MKTKLLMALFAIAAAFFGSKINLSIPFASAGKVAEDTAFYFSGIGRTTLQSPAIERFLESEPESVYSGDFLKAFLAAYASFKADSAIPLSKRAIENYQVEFRQDKESYLVVFTIGSKTKEKVTLGGESDLTKSVLYVISKRNYRVKSRLFFK